MRPTLYQLSQGSVAESPMLPHMCGTGAELDKCSRPDPNFESSWDIKHSLSVSAATTHATQNRNWLAAEQSSSPLDEGGSGERVCSVCCGSLVRKSDRICGQ